MTDIIRPTPERLRHAGNDVEELQPDENVNFKTLRMLDGSPLEKLATAGRSNPRKGITGDQYHAGARYYADAFHAGLLASGVADPARERVDGGEHKELSDFVMAAKTRFNRAVLAIGRIHCYVLDGIVLCECPVHEYAERFREFARARDRSIAALTALRLALDALDLHYNGKRRNGRYTAHTTNYRPSLTMES